MLKAIGVCGMSAIGLLVLNFIRVEGKPLINQNPDFCASNTVALNFIVGGYISVSRRDEKS